jgi:hypothetical protein
MHQADPATSDTRSRLERFDRVVPLGGGPALPDTVSEAILRRVENLPRGSRRILGVAALLGREFDLELLAATTGLDAGAVEHAVTEAQHASVVEAVRPGTFRFSHALVQSTLACSTDERRAARLHRRAADALEHLHPDDPPFAAIAHHLLSALPDGDRSRAVRYAWQAGDAACQQFCDDQATGHYRRAIEAATDDEPAGVEPVLTVAEIAELYLRLGEAHLRTGRVDRARPACADAARYAREVPDPVLLARAALAFGGGADVSIGFEFSGRDDELISLLEDARALLTAPEQRALRAIVAARLAGARYDAAEFEVADRLTAEAVAVARQAQDPRSLAFALAARHSAIWRADSLVERLAIADELSTLDGAPGSPIGFQGYVWRVADLLECGDFDAADAQIDAFANALLPGAHARFHWYVWLYRAMRSMVEGRLDDASSEVEKARAFGIRAGAFNVGTSYAVQTFFLARDRGALGGVADLLDAFADSQPAQPAWRVAALFARVEAGEPVADAREQLDAFLADDCAALPDNGFLLTNYVLLAETCARLGAVEEARTLYRLLLPYRDRVVVVSRVLACLGSVEHFLALLATTTGDLDAARAHVHAARAGHDALRSPILRTRTDLAEVALLRAVGDDAKADTIATAVAETADAHGWTDIARRARG